jgi:hypothetical protein
MADNYDPNKLGSDTMPSEYCDKPIADDTAKDVQQAREAVRQHKIVNDLAERGNRR